MNLVRSVALLSVLTLGLYVGFPATAQTVVGDEPGIVVVGTGTATAPADVATLQFLVMSNFGMQPGAQNQLNDEQLESIVLALVANGVAETDITLTIPASIPGFSVGGPPIGEVKAVIRQPERDQLPELVEAIRNVELEGGLQVFHVGGRYEPADCESLTQEAREAAIADARMRGAGVAAGLGEELGDVVQAMEMTSFGAPGQQSCAPAGMGDSYGPLGAGSEPLFDPEMTEARVTVQMALTFAFADDGS